jgi:D-glycero-D-manno-heptose 1,7-bisphosphate phosphatase
VAPFVLLDRDGVLNVDLPGSVNSLAEMTMIPGAAEAVALLNRKGCRVLVATNQACVGRGQLSRAALDEIHREMDAQVTAVGGKIEAWFVCAHRAEEHCACRKPKPGLLLEAAGHYGFSPAGTWFVGDSGRDVEAAMAAGCRPALVLTGKGSRASREHPDVPAFEDLLAFARSFPTA